MKINHIKIIGNEARGKTFLLGTMKEKLGDNAIFLSSFTEAALKKVLTKATGKSLTILMDSDLISSAKASSFLNELDNEINSDVELFVYQVCKW